MALPKPFNASLTEERSTRTRVVRSGEFTISHLCLESRQESHGSRDRLVCRGKSLPKARERIRCARLSPIIIVRKDYLAIWTPNAINLRRGLQRWSLCSLRNKHALNLTRIRLQSWNETLQRPDRR